MFSPLQISPETFVILRRLQQDIFINVESLHVKYPLFLLNFELSRQNLKGKKKAPISNLIKIRPVGAKLFHADGRTDERT